MADKKLIGPVQALFSGAGTAVITRDELVEMQAARIAELEAQLTETPEQRQRRARDQIEAAELQSLLLREHHVVAPAYPAGNMAWAKAALERQAELLEIERQRTVDVGAIALDAAPFRRKIAELERQLAEKLELPIGEPLECIKQVGEKLVRTADLFGVVLTIEQRPLQPLAMGNYETVVEVRPARVMADPNAPGKCAVSSCDNPCSPPAGLCSRCIDLMEG